MATLCGPYSFDFNHHTIDYMIEYTLEPANFADYREFLKFRFETLKKNNPKFSINACAQKSKISKSLLQFIFRKKRHVSLDRFPNLAQALKLSSDEEYFVYLMICKDSSSNKEVKIHFEKILGRLRHESVRVDVKSPAENSQNFKSLYLDYLFMIIQTLTRLPEFKEDPK